MRAQPALPCASESEDRFSCDLSADRLMYDHHDQLARGRLFLEKIHHVLRVCRRQARCRLIDKQDGGLTYKLEGDIESFALGSADRCRANI